MMVRRMGRRKKSNIFRKSFLPSFICCKEVVNSDWVQLIFGFKWAIAHDYDYVFEMDADFSHNPDDLVRLYQACADGHDMAVGSRYVNGVNVVNWPIGRVFMSYFAGYYVRMITGMPVMDPTAGFVCYRSEVLKTIDLDSIRFVGYAFQIEMKFSAWKYQGSLNYFHRPDKGAVQNVQGDFQRSYFRGGEYEAEKLLQKIHSSAKYC
jgi:dolichol-phosphate mannosyltransferase